MQSALRMVERRWAITMVDLPFMALSSASCTTLSLFASSADVASSRRRRGGLRTMARAMAILCFWPPDSWVPLSPTSVSRPSGRPCTNSAALAILSASSISASVAPFLPYRMFSRMVVPKRTGSCPTTPI
mmetsp:Transcript_11465/g.30379  ORF Transcript_11465/g.30379 Transcript_11465/m.30379 type:complete len:130 (+) Transcript_11465:235-624(+)